MGTVGSLERAEHQTRETSDGEILLQADTLSQWHKAESNRNRGGHPILSANGERGGEVDKARILKFKRFSLGGG